MKECFAAKISSADFFRFVSQRLVLTVQFERFNETLPFVGNAKIDGILHVLNGSFEVAGFSAGGGEPMKCATLLEIRHLARLRS